MIQCATQYEIDWVTVCSDPYCEAEAYGLKVEYPVNRLPYETSSLIKNFEQVKDLKVLVTKEHKRMSARIEEIQNYQRECGNSKFILGWVEGPMAEYADLRGLSDACMDLYDEAENIEEVFDILLKSAMDFAKLQIEAGAHCIGIGDAACSQIGPELYKLFIWEREKALVEHIHANGALAKLHICGNTTSILSDMIATGSDIIDVDHLVKDLTFINKTLGPNQVISGNVDPVSVIQDGSTIKIQQSVLEVQQSLQGRCIISAGCEIPRDTTVENMSVFRQCCQSYDTGSKI